MHKTHIHTTHIYTKTYIYIYHICSLHTHPCSTQMHCIYLYAYNLYMYHTSHTVHIHTTHIEHTLLSLRNRMGNEQRHCHKPWKTCIVCVFFYVSLHPRNSHSSFCINPVICYRESSYQLSFLIPIRV